MTENVRQPICPLRMRQPDVRNDLCETIPCPCDERCMWWDPDNQCCCLRTIAKALDAMAR